MRFLDNGQWGALCEVVNFLLVSLQCILDPWDSCLGLWCFTAESFVSHRHVKGGVGLHASGLHLRTPNFVYYACASQVATIIIAAQPMAEPTSAVSRLGPEQKSPNF